jgi:hypothetical protein
MALLVELGTKDVGVEGVGFAAEGARGHLSFGGGFEALAAEGVACFFCFCLGGFVVCMVR